MPSSFLGVALLVVLLAPGFVYLTRRETVYAAREYTTLRETALVVTTSLLFDVLALGVFALLRWRMPDTTPDVGRFVREESQYLKLHYRSVAAWSVAVLGLSMSLAWVVSVPPRWFCYLVGDKPGWRQWLTRRGDRPAIRQESGWSYLFQTLAERDAVWVSCELHDGTTIAGWHRSSNPDLNERPDRSLILSGPLRVRPSGERDFADLGSPYVVIADREIQYLTVSYHAVAEGAVF